jgi:hypothetical protein
MLKYFDKLLVNVKISAYNYFYSEQNDDGEPRARIIHKTFENTIDDKQLRIDTLLFVRQYKNTYYKYTNKDNFNHELYNTFLDDKHFDGGNSGYDDDDEVRIFDRYILEYIKNRNDIVTFLLCKNKEVILKTKLEDLVDVFDEKNKSNKIDILFTIDMNEKELFSYCHSIVCKNYEIAAIKHIVFSFICKYKGEYVRTKLNAFTSDKKNHPYLILESFLA